MHGHGVMIGNPIATNLRMVIAFSLLLGSAGTHADPLLDALHVAKGKWVQCTKAAAAKLAKRTDENAETIVVGVFGMCKSLEEDYYQTALRAKLSLQKADDLRRQIREIAREQIVAKVLALRAR
jgi:hypothetical protein